jgi:hypothetical protein
MRTLLICLAMLAGCNAAKPAPSQPVVYPQYPKLSAHCRECKQCASPMDADGNEQSLCEEGFRLLQDDLRPATR